MTAIVFEKVFFAFETDGNSLPPDPAIYHQGPNVFAPLSTTSIHIAPHRSRLVRTVCTRKACNPFRKYRELVEPVCNDHNHLKAFFFGGQFGKHATFSKLLDPVEPSPSYQKSVRIILIFVAPIFDGSIFYQKYFLDLIAYSTVVYGIFRIFAA